AALVHSHRRLVDVAARCASRGFFHIGGGIDGPARRAVYLERHLDAMGSEACGGCSRASRAVCACQVIPFQVYTVPSQALLEDAFDKIADAARQGCRPLLHIDMHGSIERGLEIAASMEFLS